MWTEIQAYRREVAQALQRHLSDLATVPVSRRKVRVSAISVEEMYVIGADHYFWISVYATQGETGPYRAVVTRARRTTSQICKECVLCMSADDLAAAMAAEVRMLHPRDSMSHTS